MDISDCCEVVQDMKQIILQLQTFTYFEDSSRSTEKFFENKHFQLTPSDPEKPTTWSICFVKLENSSMDILVAHSEHFVRNVAVNFKTT